MKSHEQNRLKVCLLCFTKAKPAKPINESLKPVIKEHFLPRYDETNKAYPKVLCGGCYIATYRCKNGENFRNIIVHRYLEEEKVNLRERRNVKCTCELCHVAEQDALSGSFGRVCKSKNKSGGVKVCDVCYTKIGRGKPHCCSKSTKIKNLLEMAAGSEDQIVGGAIRKKDLSPESLLTVSNCRGKPTRLKRMTCKEKKQRTPITHNELIEWKTDLNLSTNQTLKLAQNMRKTDRKRIQPGLKQNLQDRMNELEDFFSVYMLEMVVYKGKKGTTRRI